MHKQIMAVDLHSITAMISMKNRSYSFLLFISVILRFLASIFRKELQCSNEKRELPGNCSYLKSYLTFKYWYVLFNLTILKT